MWWGMHKIILHVIEILTHSRRHELTHSWFGNGVTYVLTIHQRGESVLKAFYLATLTHLISGSTRRVCLLPCLIDPC